MPSKYLIAYLLEIILLVIINTDKNNTVIFKKITRQH